MIEDIYVSSYRNIGIFEMTNCRAKSIMVPVDEKIGVDVVAVSFLLIDELPVQRRPL